MSDVTQFLGRLVPNTQCDYKLDNCSQRKCLVRSPHYPGLYPRNLTCSYHIFVLPGEVPSGKQANSKHTKTPKVEGMKSQRAGKAQLCLVSSSSFLYLLWCFQLWSSLAFCSVLDNNLMLNNSLKRNLFFIFSFDAEFCLNCLLFIKLWFKTEWKLVCLLK